jgi:RNA polymerase sigma-70 factor (ECF subfamily)
MENRKDIKNIDQFELLFKEYFIPLSHYSYKIVKDIDSAKEIVHNVFVNLWEKRNEVHTNVPLRSYLFTAVRNRSLNYLRDNSKFTSADSEVIGEIVDPQTEDPLDVDESQLQRRIFMEINNLPERCAEIFKLARFENLKYREIAEKLNISVKTVEAQMSKALRILRDNLSDIIQVLILWILYFFYNFL